jgi:hypothetical protein
MPRYRCAVLDDYQNVATNMADWSLLADEIDVAVFNEHLGDAASVIAALAEFEIVCAMRERTPFPRAVLVALVAAAVAYDWFGQKQPEDNRDEEKQ